MSWEVEPTDEVAELRAFAHPVRLRMLSLLRGRELSATQLAVDLGIATASASYHLRKLAAASLVEVAGERVRRGGKERFYRLARPISELPFGERDRREFADSALAEAHRKIAQADLSVPSTIGDAELWLDPQDWADLVERQRQLMTELTKRAQSRGSAGTAPVSMTVLWHGLRS